MSTHAKFSYSTNTISYKYKQINGVNIFYREAGKSGLPVLVLLHGYPSSSQMYAPLLPLLAPYFHVIAPDYPGFGHSDFPAPSVYTYTFDNLALTMLSLLEELGIDNYTLFMQDYGGPVGFRMALSQPDRIDSLIIQNANSYIEGLGKKWEQLSLYWQNPEANVDQLKTFMSFEAAKQRHLGESPSPQRYSPDCWEEEFAMLSRQGSEAIQASLFFDYQNNIKAYSAWQQWLRDIQPRMLILWGKYDPSFIVPGAQAYLRDVPNAELHLLNAGHFALDEATEEVAKLTIDFLSHK